MSKIITVTCNTALDYHLELDELKPGATLLAHKQHCFAGGKGVNVAKTVAALDLPVLALGFVGEQSMPMFSSLADRYIQLDFTAVDGMTRSNLTLTEPHNETHIRSPGFTVSNNDCQRLLKNLERHLQSDDIVVLSGSLPPGAPKDFFKTLVALCHRHQARPLLDSNGPGLHFGMQAQPYLCKPNLDELRELSGLSLDHTDAIIAAAGHLTASNCQQLVVSMDQFGLIACNAQTTLSAAIETLTEPICSSVGCGDALVAGLAIAQQQKLPFDRSISLAIACATANLASIEPGRVDADLVEHYRRRVQFDYL